MRLFISALTEESSSLIGKKILFMGDSITYAEDPGYVEWVTPITLAETINIGVGGAAFAERPTLPEWDAASFTHVVDSIVADDWTEQASSDKIAAATLTRMQALDMSTIDFVVIAFGQNDRSTPSVPLGTDTDTDRETFWGAINYGVDALISNFPDVDIILIVPYNRYDSGGNVRIPLMSTYADVIRDKSNNISRPYVDLFNDWGIDEVTALIWLDVLQLHPKNAFYYQQLGEFIAGSLLSKL